MAEADGIAAPAIEVLEVEMGIAHAEEIAPEPEAGRRRETRAFRQEVVDDLGVGLTAHPLQVGNVVAVARGEAPDRALRRMSPVVERDNRPVADLDDVVVAGPDLAVGVRDVESAVDFFCPRARGEGARRHHEVGPCAGINHSSVTLSAKGRTDVPAITGEDDAAHEGTAPRHVAELDAQAPALDDGRDLALAGRPALAPHFAAARRFGVMLVVAHPNAEVACERVEPLDQRGLRLAGFGPGRWHVLLHRSKQTMSAPAVFLDETVPTSHSARELPHVEAYRAAEIPWPTVSSLLYTTALEGARSHREAGVCSQGD